MSQSSGDHKQTAQPSAPSRKPLGEELHSSQAQLLAYARDLKQLLDREGRQSQQLKKAHAQTLAYAKDLKLALQAEQLKNVQLEQSYADTILRLARASRYKDEETGGHIERLSHYARMLAHLIGWEQSEAQRLFTVAPMHDVGKIGIPDAVLSKSGPLTEEEWAQVKRHPGIGASLLEGSSSTLLEMARDVAYTHHERWDGTGYPRGLRGKQIPMVGRIVMLCDLYDALRSVRPYKPAFSHKKVCYVMLNGNGRTRPSHFDPELLEVFREYHAEFDRIFSTIVGEEETA